MIQQFGRSGSSGFPVLALSMLPWVAALILSLAGLALTGPTPPLVGWIGITASATGGLALALILFRGIGRLGRTLPSSWRAAGVTAAIVATAAVQAGTDIAWREMTGGALSSLMVTGSLVRDFFAALLLYLLLDTAAAALSFARCLAEEMRRLDQSRFEAETGLLRLQLNPHFMVNALNAVSSLILSGQHPKAAAMTDKLSQFLRLSLQMSGTSLISLGDELFAVETYLDAEAIRFGDRLRIEIDCPEALETVPVPNFILQPLAQAAVKYGLSASIGATPVVISASAEDGMLVLGVRSGSGDVAGMHVPGQGVGIESIKARLSLFYGEQASLSIDMREGYRAEIRLPLNHNR